MSRAAAVLLAVALVGCASQPHASLPPPEEQPSVRAPDPDATTAAADLAMFGERLRQALAVVVSGFLAPGYQDAE